MDLILTYDYEGVPHDLDGELDLVHLLDERVNVALPDGHPRAADEVVRLADLAEESWVSGTESGSCREMVRRACLAAGFEPKIAFSSYDYQILQGLVAAGVGITLLPELALAGRHPGIQIRPLSPAAPARRVWAATLAGSYCSPATEAMIEVLRESASAFGASGRSSRQNET